MPVIETQRDDIRNLKGVHVFHFAGSNCSQRVRFALDEKGVKWISHHVDLIKCENATPEFVAINPKGVVPVLIHDGKTIVESNDIIRYVDQIFDGPILTPLRESEREYLEQSLQRSSSFQAALKLLTHEFLFKPFRRMNEKQLEQYAKGTANVDLANFMRDFSSREGFGRGRIAAAITEAEDILHSLEFKLADHPWLSGESFGLTDISWVVTLHRFTQMHDPFIAFPRVEDWLARMRARPSFRTAITRYESRRMLAAFNIYTLSRRLRSSSVRSYIPDRGS